jgi:uncharacterized protein YycO
MKLIIGFSKAKSPYKIGSWLIRKYLGTEYSHVYMNFHSCKFDRDIVYEAVGSGVRFVGIKEWKKHATVVVQYDIEISDTSYIKLMQFCIDNSGRDYGFLQNIGIVFARLFKLTKNPFKSGVNCSELLADILELEGYKWGIPKDLITPKDIENSLLSFKDITTITRDDRQ